jgi:hypothetical protein
LQPAPRSYAAAGVAIVGTGLITVTPVPPQPPSPDLQEHAVSLSAVTDALADPLPALSLDDPFGVVYAIFVDLVTIPLSLIVNLISALIDQSDELVDDFTSGDIGAGLELAAQIFIVYPLFSFVPLVNTILGLFGLDGITPDGAAAVTTGAAPIDDIGTPGISDAVADSEIGSPAEAALGPLTAESFADALPTALGDMPAEPLGDLPVTLADVLTGVF